MKIVNRALATLLIFYYNLGSVVKAQGFEVVYLTIGSRHYANSVMCEANNCRSYNEITGATQSAKLAAQFFKKYANASGFELLSRIEPHHKYNVEPILLTRELIMEYVDSLKIKVKAKKREVGANKSVLSIVYYCGHGISNNLTNATYLVPGFYCDCEYTKAQRYQYVYEDTFKGTKLSRADSLKFSNDVRILSDILYYNDFCVYLGDIYDSLKTLGSPFIILADCCLDRDSKLKLSRFSTLQKNVFKKEFEKIRLINEYRESNPVIFSTNFGKSVQTVPLKVDGVIKEVGPICRRLYAIATKVNHRKKLTLSEFVTFLKTSSSNKVNSSCVTFYKPDLNGIKVFLTSK